MQYVKIIIMLSPGGVSELHLLILKPSLNVTANQKIKHTE